MVGENHRCKHQTTSGRPFDVHTKTAPELLADEWVRPLQNRIGPQRERTSIRRVAHYVGLGLVFREGEEIVGAALPRSPADRPGALLP